MCSLVCDVCESDWLATEVPLLLIGWCVRGYKSDWLNLTALKSLGTEDHSESGRLRTRVRFGFHWLVFQLYNWLKFTRSYWLLKRENDPPSN